MTKEEQNQRINTIIRHIKRVEDNCNKLAQAITDSGGNLNMARKLVQLGRIHDASKFDKFEFMYLGNFEKEKPPEFVYALKQHHKKNPHHPEFWEHGIKEMPEMYLAEMVCDCVARGQEFGTDSRKWFFEEATKKYGFTLEDECGKSIIKYLDLLLNKPFNNGSGN